MSTWCIGNRGVTALVATVYILAIVATVILGVILLDVELRHEYTKAIRRAQYWELERMRENIALTPIKKDDSVALEVRNKGSVAVHLVDIWVIDNKTKLPLPAFSPRHVNAKLLPGEIVTIELGKLKNGVYIVKVFTGKGNFAFTVIEVRAET